MASEVIIRPYRPNDAPLLFEAVRASLTQVSPWLPWCHEDYSLEEATWWATTQAQEFQQAVRQVVTFAFTETDLERLEIVCALDNHASQRVAEKAGAVKEGVARGRVYLQGRACDAVVYSILRSDNHRVRKSLAPPL